MVNNKKMEDVKWMMELVQLKSTGYSLDIGFPQIEEDKRRLTVPCSAYSAPSLCALCG
jgi:hypothetical protein